MSENAKITMKAVPERDGFRIEGSAGEIILGCLSLSAAVAGRRVRATGWKSVAAGRFEAEVDGIGFGAEFLPGPGSLVVKAEFVNRTGVAVEVEDIRWSRLSGRDSLAVPGPELRLYREGWSMPSACGSVGWGETDFGCDPDYLSFATSAPERFEPPKPNRFTSEYVTVLMPENADSLLAGFITTADRVCRFEVELGEAEVVQFEAVSCGDNCRLDPGAAFRSEELLLMRGAEPYALLKDYAKRWGERMNIRRWGHTPSGWCSWYYYFSKVTEADVIENLNYLKEHRAEYPLEYLQIDDGYEAALGDWLTTNDKFPHGLEWMAARIHEAGLKPGLWLAPFMVEERSNLVVEHPEYLVHDAAGGIAWTTEWRGCRVAVLDGTHPGAREFLRGLFRHLAEIGFDYVKLDFMMYACAPKDGRYHDPRATRAQALRRGLSAIREGFGDERFILGCTAPLGPVAGIVDAERIGTDITPYWQRKDRPVYAEAPTVPNVCRNLINRVYMHRNLWISDPDVHIARIDNNELTENEIRLWTSALWMVGGLTLLSDRFETLAPERAELSKLLLRRTDAFEDVRPFDFRESAVPSVWFGRFAETGAPVYGFFNFGETARNFSVRHDGVERNFVEYWSKAAVEVRDGVLEAAVPPHSCRIFFGGAAQ